MADLVVIYDPVLEMGAIVDVDEQASWGPAMVGPQAADILQAFLDSVPFDMTTMPTMFVTDAFRSFLDRIVAAAPQTQAPPDSDAVVQQANPGMADGTVVTTAQGAPTDEPPAPAPHDTDASVETHAGETDQVMQPGAAYSPAGAIEPPQYQQCVLCDGLGVVSQGEGQAPQPCGMCGGKGKVPVVAQAAPQQQQ